MKIWLDDVRPMPQGYDLHVMTASEAIAILERGNVEEISFDHDLGDDKDGTGYDVAKFIEKNAYLNHCPPPRWKVHSANPVGRENIKRAMEAAERHFASWSEEPRA